MAEHDAKMVLRTVYLPPDLDEKLRLRAFQSKVSKGDVIRHLLQLELASEPSVKQTNLRADSEAIQSRLKPAVPIKKSIADDYLVCLEDGKKFKSMKRYLRTQYNMSPSEYREKWGLSEDYPMVAPNYAAARSKMAEKFNFGRYRDQPVPRDAALKGESLTSPAEMAETGVTNKGARMRRNRAA